MLNGRAQQLYALTHGGGGPELIEGMSIAVNFSGGDQIVFAPDGYAVKSATIKKPTNLLPENIAKDVDIAGVVGTYEGSGVGEGCVTVTFMDRGEVLFTRPVYIGDDCPNPVTQGRIEAPTKESTVQYDYTFSGWSATNGGTASAFALSNITADKTVYAAFTSEVRYYTVTFYDGTTLLNTEQVAYGGSSTYEYKKQGYVFNGWTPEPTNITSDLACYGAWEESDEIGDTWEEIVAAIADGTYTTKYNVGQYKPLDLGDEGIINMQIVAMDSESGKETLDGDMVSLATSWVAKEVLTTSVKYNSQGYQEGVDGTGTNGGWEDCELRAYLQETILPMLPTVLQTNIKYARKTTYYKPKYSNNYTYDKLWVPSRREVTTYTTDIENSGPRYNDIYTGNHATRVKTRNGENAWWWLRSVMSTDNVAVVNATGSLSAYGATGGYSVCLGFCI